MTTTLSREQIIDAAGGLNDSLQATIRTETNAAPLETLDDPVPGPSYEEAALRFGADARTDSFTLEPNGWTADDPRLGSLGRLAGLRLQVGVNTGDGRPASFPGIVLPDSANGVRLGILAGPDMLTDPKQPLGDLQHRLLEQLAAMHMPGIGEHAADQRTNVGDIGHAALIAVTPEQAQASIHGQVHSAVADGLAPSIAKSGALTIGTLEGARPVRELTIAVRQAGQLVVPKNYQRPGGLVLPASVAAVGVTRAAKLTQAEHLPGMFPQPDIVANTRALLAQEAV